MQLKLLSKIKIKRILKRDSRLESLYLLSKKLKKFYTNDDLNNLIIDNHGGNYFSFLKFFSDIEYTIVKIQGTTDFLAYSKSKVATIKHQSFFESNL